MSGESARLALTLPPLRATRNETSHLYGELHKPLLRYLMCLGLSSDEAQDVAHDAFLTLQQQSASLQAHENPRAWLFRVAHNQARNRQMRYERRFAAPLSEAMEVPAAVTTPEQAVLAKEKFRQMRAAIASLTPAERECLFLRASGLRYREISDVLELPASTVGDTVERAIRKLAEKCNV